MNFLAKLFGLGSKIDFKQLVKDGAIIIDVRTPSEFKSGHISGSKNMDLSGLRKNVHSLLPKDQTILIVCASGIRSASAKSILSSHGFENVYNGGGWRTLQSKLN